MIIEKQMTIPCKTPKGVILFSSRPLIKQIY